VTPVSGLRLVAQDIADLEVCSAALQDGLLRVRDLSFDRRARRLVGVFSRFRWEASSGPGPYQRVRSALSIDGVMAVRSRNIRLDSPDAIASLLSLHFTPDAEPPGGELRLLLSGGGEIGLKLECLDLVLADFGEPWKTRRKPEHQETA
jgi:hypothetical protein